MMKKIVKKSVAKGSILDRIIDPTGRRMLDSIQSHLSEIANLDYENKRALASFAQAEKNLEQRQSEVNKIQGQVEAAMKKVDSDKKRIIACLQKINIDKVKINKKPVHANKERTVVDELESRNEV